MRRCDEVITKCPWTGWKSIKRDATWRARLNIEKWGQWNNIIVTIKVIQVVVTRATEIYCKLFREGSVLSSDFFSCFLAIMRRCLASHPSGLIKLKESICENGRLPKQYLLVDKLQSFLMRILFPKLKKLPQSHLFNGSLLPCLSSRISSDLLIHSSLSLSLSLYYSRVNKSKRIDPMLSTLPVLTFCISRREPTNN